MEFHGTDIGARCVRMTHVNLILYGTASYVVRHQNSLSLEPDFSPPRVGRVQWYALRDKTPVAEPIPTPVVVEMAGEPVADPMPKPRPATPSPAPTPVLDVV